VQKQIIGIPPKDREAVLFALRDMQADPFFGDIKWLKNQQYTLRRRVGVWRILFDIDRESKIILIGDIVRRSDNTY
jgi:mRNA-degrading endonuclease RelE of RelBE toxin-antitoxin system